MATNERGNHKRGVPSVDVPELCARVTTASDGTTECTIFPEDLPKAERTTTWITAGEGSFLDAEAVR